ncbi:hypothetical protein F1D05_09620 [Kribbella qitaiheensis]|uniref:Uncharacterized protein n=1 Tax=Kribbella qitaiheensis TaxID=1544730 RepID=A0A7G6WVT3_9ACTN|nr:hypothetical protein [Kribbella qitaiheensis]QNE18098.1 hypothetical protein F1D05_09620 [Kribbella qitaiheensis]
MEFAEPALFEAHMADVHGFKSFSQHTSPSLRTPTWVSAADKPWKWRPTKSAKIFTPKPLEPGADVTWREYAPTGRTLTNPKDTNELTGQHVPESTQPESEWIERTGQVWSLNSNSSVWVVPHLPAREELAVLVDHKRHDARAVGFYLRTVDTKIAPLPGTASPNYSSSCDEPALEVVL